MFVVGYMELFWCVLQLAWNGNSEISGVFFYWNALIADEKNLNSSAKVLKKKKSFSRRNML